MPECVQKELRFNEILNQIRRSSLSYADDEEHLMSVHIPKTTVAVRYINLLLFAHYKQ